MLQPIVYGFGLGVRYLDNGLFWERRSGYTRIHDSDFRGRYLPLESGLMGACIKGKKEARMSSSNGSYSNGQCCICSEIQSGRLPPLYEEKYDIAYRNCLETRDFVVFPSVSPLTFGHLLLFPKRHVTSLAQLNSKCLQNLCKIVTQLAARVSVRSDPPYFFEHGVPENGTGGCGITHAHLHLLPLPTSIALSADGRVSKEYPPDRSGDLVHMLDTHIPGFHYLLFGQDLGDLRLSFSSGLPSQYMRRIIAEETGLTCWDWRELSGVNLFRRTIKEIGMLEAVVG